MPAPVIVAATPSGSFGNWLGTGGTHDGVEPDVEADVDVDALEVPDEELALVVELELDELLPHAATADATNNDSTRARSLRPATTRMGILSPSIGGRSILESRAPVI